MPKIAYVAKRFRDEKRWQVKVKEERQLKEQLQCVSDNWADVAREYGEE